MYIKPKIYCLNPKEFFLKGLIVSFKFSSETLSNVENQPYSQSHTKDKKGHFVQIPFTFLMSMRLIQGKIKNLFPEIQ